MHLTQNNAWATREPWGDSCHVALLRFAWHPTLPADAGCPGELVLEVLSLRRGLRKHILVSVWVFPVPAFSLLNSGFPEGLKITVGSQRWNGLNSEWTQMCWPRTLTKQSLSTLHLSGRGAGDQAEHCRQHTLALCHGVHQALLPPSVTLWPSPFLGQGAHPFFLCYRSFT